MKRRQLTTSLLVVALTIGLLLTAWQLQASRRTWKSCVNDVYSYELRYPPTYLIYIPASGTHTPSVRETTTCNGERDLLILAPHEEQMPRHADILVLGTPALQGSSVAIRVYSQDELAATVYVGATDLHTYFARNTALGTLENLPKVDIDRVLFVHHAGRLLGFHDNHLYEIIVTGENDATRTILSTFRLN